MGWGSEVREKERERKREMDGPFFLRREGGLLVFFCMKIIEGLFYKKKNNFNNLDLISF